MNPELGKIYCNRGEARLHLREWEDARKDFAIARDMGVDIVASFRNDYKEGVKRFEEKTGIVLPPDIAEMLEGDGCDRPKSKDLGFYKKLSRSICGMQKRTVRFNGTANNPIE